MIAVLSGLILLAMLLIGAFLLWVIHGSEE